MKRFILFFLMTIPLLAMTQDAIQYEYKTVIQDYTGTSRSRVLISSDNGTVEEFVVMDILGYKIKTAYDLSAALVKVKELNEKGFEVMNSGGLPDGTEARHSDMYFLLKKKKK